MVNAIVIVNTASCVSTCNIVHLAADAYFYVLQLRVAIEVHGVASKFDEHTSITSRRRDGPAIFMVNAIVIVNTASCVSTCNIVHLAVDAGAYLLKYSELVLGMPWVFCSSRFEVERSPFV